MLSRIGYIKVFIKDPDKKNMGRLVKELIRYAWIKKTLPSDYFRKFLYRKEVDNYLDYLSLKEYYSIIESKKIVFPEISALLHHKLSFKLLALKHHLPVSELLAYTLNHQLTLGHKTIPLSSPEQLYNLLKDLLTNMPQESLFVKPMLGIGGAHCKRLELDTLKSMVNNHFYEWTTGGYLIEKGLIQHPVISTIYPKSINTLRIIHYIDKTHKVHILSSLMRFGLGGSVTDNTSAGGISIAINSHTGELYGPARQNLVKGARVFYRHPDTNKAWEGCKVPYFKEACDLVKTAAFCFPNRIVGWDIAITPNGPVIIEANHNPSLHLSDIAYGGFLKHPLVNDLLNEINNQ